MDIHDYATSAAEELAEDAQTLGCGADPRGVLDIVWNGDGADRQGDHFRLRRLEGDTEAESLRSVADLVIAKTKEPVGGLSRPKRRSSGGGPLTEPDVGAPA